MPSNASSTPNSESTTTDPGTPTPSGPSTTTMTSATCIVATRTKRKRVANEEIQLRNRHREKAFKGAAGSLTEHRHRRDQEHQNEREYCDENRCEVVEDEHAVIKGVSQQDHQHHRHHEKHRHGAWVRPQLGEHSARRRMPSVARSPLASLRRMRWRNAHPFQRASSWSSPLGCRRPATGRRGAAASADNASPPP